MTDLIYCCSELDTGGSVRTGSILNLSQILRNGNYFKISGAVTGRKSDSSKFQKLLLRFDVIIWNLMQMVPLESEVYTS